MTADLEAALERLNLQLILNQKDPWTRYNQAWTLQRLGRFQEAADSFERTVKLKPEMSEAHFHLGECRVALGQAEPAAAAFRAAAAARPDYLEALLAEIDALVKLGRTAETAAPLRRATELDAGNLRLVLQLAEVEAAAGNVGATVTLYERATRLAPDDKEIQLAHARALSAARRFESAQRLLATLAPALGRREGHVLLAEACLGLEQRLEAAAAYRAALAIEPDHLPTLTAAAALAA